MAIPNSLLNYINTYAEIATKGLAINDPDSPDYLRLIFTGDGDIITHGLNYTSVFSTTRKGLVPKSTGSSKEMLRGNGNWAAITLADLPAVQTVNESVLAQTTDSTILSTKGVMDYVKAMIADGFEANNAMRYLGSISYDSTGNTYSTTTDSGTTAGFPASCKVGDTYSVATAGTYAGETCVAGDLLICIKDGSGSINSSTYWTVIEANINGVVKNSVNGTPIYTYSSATQAFNIYAPETWGNTNQVLISQGQSKAPIWTNQNSITAGDITDTAKKALLTSVSLSTTGVVSVTVGGTTKDSSAASGTWGISITGTAGKVANKLSAGTGLSMTDYDGSAAQTINLVAATSSTLGGVTVDKDNTNKTISVSSGNIYLTKQNVINALGFTPATDASVNNITLATSEKDGLVPKFDALAGSLNSSAFWILAKNSSNTLDWYSLPTSVFEATTYALSGALSNNTYVVTLTPSEGSPTTATIPAFVGATASAAGKAGLVIAPAAGSEGKFLKGDGTWGTPTNTTYSVALYNKLGLVKPAYSNTTAVTLTTASASVSNAITVEARTTTTGRYYAVEIDKDGRLYVNVPWSNTTYGVVSSSANGLAPKVISTNTNAITNAYYILASSNGSNTPSWYKLPATAFANDNTWRDIRVGGTSIGQASLNFIPTGDIYVKVDSNTSDNVYDLSFGLSWYNISSGAYETV